MVNLEVKVFSLGDEVKIKVAGVNLEERKIDFELIQQLSHTGRAIRARAPRVAKPTAKEEVFSENVKPTLLKMENRPYDAKNRNLSPVHSVKSR